MPPRFQLFITQKLSYVKHDLFLRWLKMHFVPRKPVGKNFIFASRTYLIFIVSRNAIIRQWKSFTSLCIKYLPQITCYLKRLKTLSINNGYHNILSGLQPCSSSKNFFLRKSATSDNVKAANRVYMRVPKLSPSLTSHGVGKAHLTLTSQHVSPQTNITWRSPSLTSHHVTVTSHGRVPTLTGQITSVKYHLSNVACQMTSVNRYMSRSNLSIVQLWSPFKIITVNCLTILWAPVNLSSFETVTVNCSTILWSPVIL